MWNWQFTKACPPPLHISTNCWDKTVVFCLPLAFVWVETKKSRGYPIELIQTFQSFLMGSFTKHSFFLWLTQILDKPNQLISLSFWGLPMNQFSTVSSRVWLYFIFFPFFGGFQKKIECLCQSQFEFSELWNIPLFQCWVLLKNFFQIWDSLYPDWNVTQMMWLKSKIIALNMSWI